MRLNKSIFTRQFLLIFGSLAVTILLTVLVINKLVPPHLHLSENLRQHSNDYLQLVANRATEIYQQQGDEGLLQWKRKHADNLNIALRPARLPPLHDDVQGRLSPRLRRAKIKPGVSPIGNPQQPEGYIIVHPRPIGPRLKRHGFGFISLLLITGLAASLLLALLIARRQTTPVQALVKSSAALSEGDLDARVDLALANRGDEYGLLGRAFNHMAQRIKQQIQGQAQLTRDISHDLRGPLARCRIATGIAQESSGPEQKNALELVQKELGQLSALIDEILVFSRLEASQQTESLQLINSHALLEEVTLAAQIEADTRPCRIELQPQQTDVTLQARPTLLRRALDNILRNAIRHTAENTTIEVNQQIVGQQLQIDIRDHGPGVPDAQLNDIFKPFHILDQARSQRQRNGLGLAITQRIIELHRGDIQARNAASGGLIISLWLPLNSDQTLV